MFFIIVNALRIAKCIYIDLNFLFFASLIESYKDSVNKAKFFIKRL